MTGFADKQQRTPGTYVNRLQAPAISLQQDQSRIEPELAAASLAPYLYAGTPALERPACTEQPMILIELMFGMMLAVFLLLVLPFLLLMAGIAGAMLLWYLAPAVLLAALIFWLIFPGSHGLAILLLVLILGLFLIERRHRRGYP